jgi:iron(III) transport system substrate-binding protein
MTTINIYTDIHGINNQEIYDRFEKKTGIKIIIKNKNGDLLIKDLIKEGEDTKADLLICSDAGQLQYATNIDLLQVIESEELDENIPLKCRHPERYWFGIGKRAKVIVYNNEKVNPEDLSTYFELSEKKWIGKLVMSNAYTISNQSLLSSIIANLGEEKAIMWNKGITNNLAQTSKGNDFDQINAIINGIGYIAIVNSNFIGKYQKLYPIKSKTIGVFYPNQSTSGTHINFRCAGVSKYSQNKQNAIKLLVFLTEERNQKIVAEEHFEYPVHPNIEISDLIKAWGEFNADALDFNFLVNNRSKTLEILKM